MNKLRVGLVAVLYVLCSVAVHAGTTTTSNMNSGGIFMDDKEGLIGLSITQNRIGVGIAVPSTSIDVNGSVFLKKTVTFDKVDRAPYSVDWSKGNCQRMVITQDGPASIKMEVPPTNSAHLILSIDYQTKSGSSERLTFDVADSTIATFNWSGGVSQNMFTSKNIDVVHFFYEKGASISTYNGFATFLYLKPQ